MAATTDGAAVRDIFDSKQLLFGSSVKKFSFVINSQIVTPNESISVLPSTADKHILIRKPLRSGTMQHPDKSSNPASPLDKVSAIPRSASFALVQYPYNRRHYHADTAKRTESADVIYNTTYTHLSR